jgi:hypothetical protein
MAKSILIIEDEAARYWAAIDKLKKSMMLRWFEVLMLLTIFLNYSVQ